jgi:ribose transport system permease protein
MAEIAPPIDVERADRGAAGIRLAMAAALRLLKRYSWAFAALLAIVLLLGTLVQDDGNFGLTQELADYAPLALAAMASTPAIVSGGGGFDISISPLMTFTSVVYIVWLVPHGLGGVVAVPILLAIGLAVGALSGVLILLLRVQPVVVTLAMYFVLIGVDGTIAPAAVTFTPNWITHLATSVGPIPGPVLTIGVPFLVWMLLGRVPYRRMLFAVGSNDAAAFSSGVSVAAVRIAAFALGGFFAAIGGIALTALVSSVDASQATTYTLIAIASVALGGTSLWGGRGGLVGAAAGAACIYLLGNFLAGLNVTPDWVQVAYGVMLIVAVILAANLGQATGDN